MTPRLLASPPTQRKSALATLGLDVHGRYRPVPSDEDGIYC